MRLQELIYEYVEHVQRVKRQRLEEELRTYVGKLADEDVSRISRSHLERFLAESTSAQAASLSSGLLLRLFAFAVQKNYIDPTSNPAVELRFPRPASSSKPRDIRREEMQRVMSAIRGLKSRPARHLLLLVIYTDLRMAEAKRLRWSEVSLEEKRLYLGARVVELSDEAIGFFSSIRRISEWVVPSVRNPQMQVGNIQKAWEIVREKTELDIRIDDLRNYKKHIV